MPGNERAAFLDRDGVIIYDPGYLHRLEDVAILPAAVGFLRQLQDRGYVLIIISNQSAVAKGLMDIDYMWKIDRELKTRLAREGIKIANSYYCPHRKEEKCNCRKPRPGLVLQAITENRIDPPRSIVIGDKPTDGQAGLAAGCPLAFLVPRNGQEHDFYGLTEGEVNDLDIKIVPDLQTILQYLP